MGWVAPVVGRAAAAMVLNGGAADPRAAHFVIRTIGVRSAWFGFGICQDSVTQAHRCEQRRGKARAKVPKRLPPCDGLGQTLGEDIEFIVHNFPYVLLWWFRFRMKSVTVH